MVDFFRLVDLRWLNAKIGQELVAASFLVDHHGTAVDEVAAGSELSSIAGQTGIRMLRGAVK